MSTQIERDLYCIECGYNLRGLDNSGKCPECATEVERSIETHTLSEIDPRRRARMIAGLWIAGVAIPVSLLLLIAATCASSVNNTATGILTVLAGGGISLGAWLLFSSRHRFGPDPLRWLAILVHVSGGAIVVLSGGVLFVSLYASAASPASAAVAVEIGLWLLWLFLFALVVAVFRVIEELAERCGCHGSVQEAQTAWFMFLVTAPLVLLTAVIARFGGSFAAVLIIAPSALCGPALLVGVIAAIRLAKQIANGHAR